MNPKTVADRLTNVQEALEGVPEDGNLTSSEKKRRKRLVDELLLLQVGAAQIAECLDAQRALADANPKLSKFPHVSDGVLKDRLSRKPANRFYNVQKAFSLPQDYRALPDGPTPESWESQAILDCIIHPEKLPTDFMNELGFVIPEPKGGRTVDYEKTVKAKIAAIPELKRMFAESVPLAKTSAGRSRAFALM